MTATQVLASVLYAAMIAAYERGDDTACIHDVHLRVALLSAALPPARFGTPKVLTGKELELVVKKLRGEA